MHSKPSLIPEILRRAWLIMLIFFLQGIRLQAQSHTLINYGREQGFNASNGYCLYQDRNGYLWIGTENGLLRFNGTSFKRFTTRDGLPDNEIFTIIEDDKGRMWLNPYASSVCYMQQGKVYNITNDSLVRRLSLNERRITILRDRNGNIWFCGQQYLIQLDKKDHIRKILSVGGSAYRELAHSVYLDRNQELVVVSNNTLYKWNGHTLTEAGALPPSFSTGLQWSSSHIYDWERGKLLFYHYHNNRIKHDTIINVFRRQDNVYNSISDNTDLLTCSDLGAQIIDLHSGRLKAHLLQDQKAGSILRTDDGTIWLGTIGKGIYRLSKTPVKSLDNLSNRSSIMYLKGTETYINFLDDRGLFTSVSFSGYKPRAETTRFDIYTGYHYIGQNRLKQWIISAGRMKLYKNFRKGLLKQINSFHVKSVIEEDTDHLLIASTNGLFRLDKNRFLITDTLICNERILSIAKSDHKIYAGTLTGLKVLSYGNNKADLVHSSFLNTHIVALASGKDNLLWVANNRSEVIGLRKDSVITVVGLKQGLHCSNIYCIAASAGFVWVGTDNGLFAISQAAPYNVTRHITYANGLNNNQVNCLSIYKNTVWAGTLQGVNYFTEDDVFRVKPKAKLIINDIKNGDRSLQPSKGTLILENKSLFIDFDILDFSSGTQPGIQYRIDNGEWISIDNNRLTFPEVPKRTFTIEISARSSASPESLIFRQTFHYPPPVYQSTWFVLLGIAILLSITVFLSVYIYHRYRRKYMTRLRTQQNLLHLEQMALQGQMNPHFIFNCIASIKQHYHSGDIVKGDHFTDVFAQLIRQTFEMGLKTFISMDKELNYLSKYLHIEQSRFNDSFTYSIIKHTELPVSEIWIPAMLLQPIVENAIRHGVRHLINKTGNIEISIKQQADLVEISIQDNGIGRKKSSALKNNYYGQSYTSSKVNDKRIHILNQLFNNTITMHISDILDAANEIGGTQVYISYPLGIYKTFTDENYNS